MSNTENVLFAILFGILARVYRLFEAQVEWQGSVAVGVLWISC